MYRIDNIMACDNHGSDRIYDAELALDGDNQMIGLRCNVIDDYGAYAEDDREKSREESPKWHRARAARLRANGFAKMAEEHEQIAEISNAGGSRNLVRGAKKSPARAGLSLGDHIVERAAHATRRLEMTSTDGCARDVMVITKMRFLLIGRK